MSSLKAPKKKHKQQPRGVRRRPDAQNEHGARLRWATPTLQTRIYFPKERVHILGLGDFVYDKVDMTEPLHGPGLLRQATAWRDGYMAKTRK
jgi:hypothetical protein